MIVVVLLYGSVLSKYFLQDLFFPVRENEMVFRIQ